MLAGSVPADTLNIIKIIDTVLLALAGLAGLIAIMRTRSIAWKWIGIAGVVWSLSGIFAWYTGTIWNWRVGGFQIIRI